MKHLSKFKKFITLFQPENNQSKPGKNPLLENELIGKWSVFMPKSIQDFSLEIFSEGTGKFNTQPLKTVTSQKNPGQLIMKDHYGYRLIIEKKENEQYFLFDELDGITYPIEKK